MSRPLTDAEIDYLEQQIPHLAEIAFKQAYWQALASGDHVWVAKDGFLVEVSPDGSERQIKPLPPGVEVKKGQTLILE